MRTGTHLARVLCNQISLSKDVLEKEGKIPQGLWQNLSSYSISVRVERHEREKESTIALQYSITSLFTYVAFVPFFSHPQTRTKKALSKPR